MATDPANDARTSVFEGTLLEDDVEVWDTGDTGDRYALVDLVNRLLDRGVVITGDITISVAGVDLAYLGLNAVLTSVTTARRTLGRPVGTDRPEVPSPE
ncbi:MAG TPA: gas vesicle protein [Longimicrobiaceae bacterium]|nr:gas vesicle protein [Longimicrobiaceae bacterium]